MHPTLGWLLRWVGEQKGMQMHPRLELVVGRQVQEQTG